MNKKTIEHFNEKYWNVRPHLRGLVKVSKKWCKKSSTGKSRQTYVELSELNTGKTGEMQWGNAIKPGNEGVPDTFDCHPYSLKNMTETYWDVHPNLKGLVEITNKFRKNGTTYVELEEISTGKTGGMYWSQALSSRLEGVPDEFDCHPRSLKNMTETYWDVRPHLRGLVEITNKWCAKSSTGKSKTIWVELSELNTGKTGEMQWSSAISPRYEGVPDTFDCYSGTRNQPSNDKLCTFYFCKTATYGRYDKWSDGPYLTIGVTTGNTKSRYYNNGLLETYFEFETYDCLNIEKTLLKQTTEKLGPPDAGKEAWKWSKEREDTISSIFNEYFNSESK